VRRLLHQKQEIQLPRQAVRYFFFSAVGGLRQGFRLRHRRKALLVPVRDRKCSGDTTFQGKVRAAAMDYSKAEYFLAVK
jgi:hypothetical protein